MSLNAAAIAVMVERGLSASDILAVAEALEVKKDRTGAERQARYRENKKAEAVTRDVTRDERNAAPALDKEIPQTPKEIKPTPYVRGTRARAKHPLPANWQPMSLKPDGQAGLIVARKPVGWIERQLSKFKDHALQNNRLCSDWDAAWRNWIKEADEIDGRRTNGLGRHQPSDGLSATTRAARDVFGIGASH